MKVVIVNCFDTYEERVNMVYDFFREKGYAVTVIQSNISHFNKEYRTLYKEDHIFIKALSYKRNLSFKRLVSHYQFSSNAFNLVRKIVPSIIYVLAPPNSLVKFASIYKKKNNNSKLIIDIMDLWPETLPIGEFENSLPLILWKSMRDRNLKFADYVITECNLYQQILKDVINNEMTETLYLAKKEINVISNPNPSKDEIHVAYLGSINNIIDIQKISQIIRALNQLKPVFLHIIGDGERMQEFIMSSKESGATVLCYGKIYDFQKKQDIFDLCHFGLNIMKENVCVGLTMKSIDYFQHGLPIINNIPSDTLDIVDKFNVGVNLKNSMNDREIRETLGSYLDISSNRSYLNFSVFFSDLFSVKSFNKKLEKVISKLV